MEVLIYFLVKILITVLVMRKVWIFLFNGTAYRMFWSRIPISEVKQRIREKAESKFNARKTEAVAESPALTDTVVGTSKVVILTDPKTGTAQPVASQELEPTGYIGQDEGITAEDIETDYNPVPQDIPSDEELYGDQPIDNYDPNMMGGGVSFEQINDAIEVLTSNEEVSEERMFKASGTLLELRGTAILDMITGEVSTQLAVDSLIGEFHTDDGVPKKGKVDKIEDIRMKGNDSNGRQWW